jgi:hypothetical protein
MGTRFDSTAAADILKEWYDEKRVSDMCFKKAPLFALMKKNKGFKGKQKPIPIRISGPQGVGATIALAQSHLAASQYDSFVVTVKPGYAVANIDNLTMKLSESDEGAFIDAATSEIDGAMMGLKNGLCYKLYGNGGGALGQASAVNTNVITLTDSETVVRFEVGMTILANANDFDGTAGTARTAKKVTAVDRDNGKITLEASHGVVANDFLFIDGDRGASSALCLTGLGGWIPSTAVSSGDSFFSVDRSVDSGRLAGRIHNGVGSPIEEALVEAARKIGRDGGAPDHCFISFSKWAELEKSLGARAQYDLVKTGDARLGFKSIVINGPGGQINVIADPFCPGNRAYLLQMDTWELLSVGEPISLFDGDGLSMLRESAADGFEVRIVSYAQVASNAPGYNGVVLL